MGIKDEVFRLDTEIEPSAESRLRFGSLRRESMILEKLFRGAKSAREQSFAKPLTLEAV